MLIERPNPSQVALQVTAHNLDGTPKTVLASATVRVYHMSGVSEVEDLASTVLAQIGSSNTWRYVWTPVALPVGQYFAEYALEDSDGATHVDVEGIVIQDFALQVDVELIRKVETGRWRIDQVTDKMYFYDENGVDVLLEFDLKDINGLPSHVNIFERDPV